MAEHQNTSDPRRSISRVTRQKAARTAGHSHSHGKEGQRYRGPADAGASANTVPEKPRQ